MQRKSMYLYIKSLKINKLKDNDHKRSHKRLWLITF